MRKYFLSSLIFLLVSSHILSASRPDDPLEKAKEKYDSGNYQDVINDLTILLDTGTNIQKLSLVYFYRGLSYSGLLMDSLAVMDFDEAFSVLIAQDKFIPPISNGFSELWPSYPQMEVIASSYNYAKKFRPNSNLSIQGKWYFPKPYNRHRHNTNKQAVGINEYRNRLMEFSENGVYRDERDSTASYTFQVLYEYNDVYVLHINAPSRYVNSNDGIRYLVARTGNLTPAAVDDNDFGSSVDYNYSPFDYNEFKDYNFLEVCGINWGREPHVWWKRGSPGESHYEAIIAEKEGDIVQKEIWDLIKKISSVLVVILLVLAGYMFIKRANSSKSKTSLNWRAGLYFASMLAGGILMLGTYSDSMNMGDAYGLGYLWLFISYGLFFISPVFLPLLILSIVKRNKKGWRSFFEICYWIGLLYFFLVAFASSFYLIF